MREVASDTISYDRRGWRQTAARWLGVVAVALLIMGPLGWYVGFTTAKQLGSVYISRNWGAGPIVAFYAPVLASFFAILSLIAKPNLLAGAIVGLAIIFDHQIFIAFLHFTGG